MYNAPGISTWFLDSTPLCWVVLCCRSYLSSSGHLMGVTTVILFLAFFSVLLWSCSVSIPFRADVELDVGDFARKIMRTFKISV